MSAVQLPRGCAVGALASSRTVRRDAAPHARVCRSLFGPVDHDELDREMKARLREMAEQDRQRWNFDFDAGVPLLGEYEWEEAPRDASPAFYRECARAGRSREAPQTPREEDGVSRGGENRGSGGLSCAAARRKRPSPLTTTHITDFYSKRRSGGAVQRSGRKTEPSAPEEQTPRKRIR